MEFSEQNEKKNILDFQFFKLRKKTEKHEIVRINNKNEEIASIKNTKSLEELEIATRIKNIKESVQRINQLISELKQISNNPNK